MKNIAILGSTGSIGTQALDVIRSSGYNVSALSAGKNITLLKKQIEEFNPSVVSVMEKEDVDFLSEIFKGISFFYGQEGIEKVAEFEKNDIVLNAVVGIAGLRGTVAAINNGKTLALANKESLVCAGCIVMPLAKSRNVKIIPVDSEHSAMFQSMEAGNKQEVKSVTLTASGGPFFGKTADELVSVTAKDALKHPSWNMGSKITIDSATLMNKGFEFIEAMWLFDLEPNQIEVVVQRESIIHSAVEFIDGNVIAQLSNPDMRLPISYAITYPLRAAIPYKKLNLAQIGRLSFYEADEDTFKCLGLCREAAERGGNAGSVINGANEAAVEAFLNDKIGFLDIYECVKFAYDRVPYIKNPTIDDIYESDRLARANAYNYIKR